MSKIKQLACLLIFFTFANAVKGQDRYDLSLQDASLTQVIDTLSEMINCKFSFPTSLLYNEQRASLRINSKELDELLQESFVNFNIEYEQANSKNILLRETNRSKEKDLKKKKDLEAITIRGQIKNKESDSPIEYAAIAIPQYNILEFSDETGAYTIALSNFKTTDVVKIHMLGYEIMNMTIDQLMQSPSIQLDAKPFDFGDIMILEKAAHLVVSPQALRLSNRGLTNLGAGLAGNDVMRSIQMLPGIDASDDSSSDLKIRGSNADETLIILDGIPLYNTSHYYGIFSSINSDYVEQVNIYKNTQPIEYGNKTAGVVEFESGKDIIHSLNGNVNLNLLESSATVHVPISKNSFLTISGRKTLRDITNTTFNSIGKRNNRPVDNGITNTQNYFDRKDVIDSDPEFNFWDIQAKYLIQFNQKNNIQFTLFKSQDNYLNEIENRFFINKDGVKFLTDEDNKVSENWNNLGAGIHWESDLTSSLQLELNTYYSSYDILNSTFSESEFYSRNNEDLEETIINEQTQFNKVQDLGINIQLKKRYNQTELLSGIKFVDHTTAFELNFSEDLEIEQNANSSEMAAYTELNHTFDNRLSISGGLRGHYYTGTNRTYFSPQVATSYAFNLETSLKASIGKNYQFLRELTVESNFGNIIDRWVLADGDQLPVSNSVNSMIGLTYKKNKVVFDVELFYKKMNNVTELSLATTRNGRTMNMTPVNTNKLFVGQGRSYGIDLLLSTEYKNLTSQIAYTLSKVEQSFRSIDRGAYFNAPNDRTHQLKLVNKYDFKNLTLGVNYTFTSGRVYTDFNKLIGVENFDRNKINPSRFKSQLPSYHRLDLSLNYNIKNLALPVTVGLGIFNVFDRQNIKYQQQILGGDPNANSPLKNVVLGTNSDLLGRTLNLSLGLKF